MNYIGASRDRPVRLIGLSTALSNAHDVAAWMGVGPRGLYNFAPSVRPVPLESHIVGFAGKHYCPRMASMNRPAYAAIKEHSPDKPVIIFVSSRRQTRLTATDLMSYCGNESDPLQWVKMTSEEMTSAVGRVKDASLKLTLQFGIGLHHAGLAESDRREVESLFVGGKIQVLVATSTLAWGVNTPTYLVIIKGTEYYDAQAKAYKDMAITDVLQMMGRAGRPQYGDDKGKAVIFVLDTKKNFYKKFLYEPFPVESSLHTQLHDHVNAEIVAGTVGSRREAVQYLTWTYYYRRLLVNPSYYGVDDPSEEGVVVHLRKVVEETIRDLIEAGCVAEEEWEKGGKNDDFGAKNDASKGKNEGFKGKNDASGPKNDLYGADKFGGKSRDTSSHDDSTNIASALAGLLDDSDSLMTASLTPTVCGRIASYYYLSYLTVRLFSNRLSLSNPTSSSLPNLLQLLCDSQEYAEFPVRHNEDILNAELARRVPWQVDARLLGSPHVKANLLLQAHMSRVQAPIPDYVTDTKGVLDQAVRILQAMVDVAADKGLLGHVLGAMRLMQCIKQGVMPRGVESREVSREVIPVESRDTSSLDEPVDEPDVEPIESTYVEEVEQEEKGGKGRSGPRGRGKASRGEKSRDDIRAPEVTWAVEDEGGGVYDVIASMKKHTSSMTSSVARASRFPKPLEEGWWLVACNESTNELKALKRVTITGSTRATSIRLQKKEGENSVTVMLVSDVYVDMIVKKTLAI